MAIPLHMLIVEDSVDDAELVARQLRRAGYDLTTDRVQTAAEMKTALDREAWDLVVCDYSMPHFDAPAALKLFQQSGLDVPFIIVSGTVGEDVAVTMMKSGAHDYILKQNLTRFVPAVQRELHEAENRQAGRLAEKALRLSEARNRAVAQSANDAIISADSAGNIMGWNHGAEAIFGYTESEAMGQPLALLAPERFRGMHLAGMDRMKSSGASDLLGKTVEMIGLRKNGDEFPLELSLAKWQAPDGWFITGIMRDITERKRAEASLRANEDRYRDLVENSLELITTLDLEGNILSVNETAVRTTGYPREALLKMNMADLVVPKMQHLFPAFLAEVQSRGETRGIMQVKTASDEKQYWEYKGTLRTDGVAVPHVRAMALNITERKRAEDAMRSSHERFEMANRATFNVIWDWDLRTNAFWRNDNFQQLFGYSMDEAETSIESSSSLIHPEDRESVRASLQVARDGASEFWSDQYRFRRKDGSYAMVEDRAIITRDSDGHAIRMLGAMQDISERKQAEEALREGELRYRTLFQANPHPMWVYDIETLRFLAVNHAAVSHYGYSEDEFLAMTIKDIRPPQDLPRLQASLAARASLGIRSSEYWRHLKRDGTLIDVEITSHGMDFGGQSARVVLANDITKRVEAERELHQYTERLEAMRGIDAALLGARSTTELAQGALTKLRHIVPFERAAVVLFDQGLTEGTILAVDQDQPWLPMAGEVRPIGDFHDLKELFSAPFMDLRDLSDIQGCTLEELLLSQGLRSIVYVPMESEDTVLGFVALSSTIPGMLNSKHTEIALDMTDQLVVAIQHTRLKEELERSNQLLESKVEKRTAELRTTVATMQVLEGELRRQEAEARAASEAKSTFLSSMSHELRTPLIGVTGMLEILTQSDLDAEQLQVVAIIHQSSESLLQIIGDILDFSKIEANKMELAPHTFSARALLESVSQTFRPAISTKGLNFVVEVDPRLAPAHLADPLRIRQVLNNFLSNAVKFTESGSITLRLRLVESGANSESLAFEVQDTGIGVSPENLEKLFQPFTQAEASTTRRFGGTGLGLIISRRLADLMGGSLIMQSTLGQGTTMTLALDLALGNVQDIVKTDFSDVYKAISLRPAPSIEAAEQERSLILMAEDHPTNRTVLTRQINRAGYALEAAVDGQDAFEKWQSGRYSLLLTDLHMPRMDGYQLTKAVRAWERAHGSSRTPILAITANALGGEAERCLELGMDDYLVKPVTIPLLASKLRQWMPHLTLGEAPETSSTAASPSPKTVGWMHPGIDSKTLLDLCGGNAGSAQEIMNDFIAATKADLLVMQDGLQQKDECCVVRQSHRLKGSAAMIGARDLADRAAKLEAYARIETPDWEIVQEQLDAIQEALKALDRVG